MLLNVLFFFSLGKTDVNTETITNFVMRVDYLGYHILFSFKVFLSFLKLI